MCKKSGQNTDPKKQHKLSKKDMERSQRATLFSFHIHRTSSETEKSGKSLHVIYLITRGHMT